MPTELDLLEPSGRCNGCWPHDGEVDGGAVGRFFILVFHRALPDLQRMKLCYSAAASSAPRSVFSWCD